MDIGTGDNGILAQLALRAGAAHVYAVEIREGAAKSARRTLNRLFPGKATVFQADLANMSARELDLREALIKAEVVVHEVFGTIASEEGIVQIFNSLLGARHGTPMVSVPEIAETLVAPVTRPSNLDQGVTNQSKSLWQGYARDRDTARARFADPQPCESIKFDQIARIDSRQTESCAFMVRRKGQWNALHLQLRLKCGRDLKLTSGGQSTNWEDVYVSVPCPKGCEKWCQGKNVLCPCMVKVGERIAFTTLCNYENDSCVYTIRITEPRRFRCEVIVDSAELHAIQLG